MVTVFYSSSHSQCDNILSYIHRFSTNACLQKLLIWSQDFFNTLQIYEVPLWVLQVNILLQISSMVLSFNIFLLSDLHLLES